MISKATTGYFMYADSWIMKLLRHTMGVDSPSLAQSDTVIAQLYVEIPSSVIQTGNIFLWKGKNITGQLVDGQKNEGAKKVFNNVDIVSYALKMGDTYVCILGHLIWQFCNLYIS